MSSTAGLEATNSIIQPTTMVLRMVAGPPIRKKSLTQAAIIPIRHELDAPVTSIYVTAELLGHPPLISPCLLSKQSGSSSPGAPLPSWWWDPAHARRGRRVHRGHSCAAQAAADSPGSGAACSPGGHCHRLAVVLKVKHCSWEHESSMLIYANAVFQNTAEIEIGISYTYTSSSKKRYWNSSGLDSYDPGIKSPKKGPHSEQTQE